MKNNNLIGISGKINSGKDTIGNIIQILTALPHLTDTGVESFLGREIDSPYKIKKFADKLKDIVCLLIGCTREQLEDREFKEKELGEEWWYYLRKVNRSIIPYNEFDSRVDDGSDFKHILIKPTPRLFLQLLGTECGRNIIHPNIWVNSLFADYKPSYIDDKGNETLKGNFDYFKSGMDKDVKEVTEQFPNWIITDLRFPNEFEVVKDRGGITIKVNRNTLIRDNNGDPIDPNKSYYAISTVQHPSETALDNETRWDYVIDNNSTIEDLIKKVREILNKENII